MSSASILLVDDEADIRNSLADALRSDGYTVETAPSVKGALAWMDACHFSVVVTDLQMPGGPSGLELIAAIKARDPKVLCIVMTGYASLDSAIEAIKHGAYDFLRKPFRLEELEAALDRSLEYAIMQSLLANYQNALENRMVIRMTEMKAYQDETLEIASRLKQGLRVPEAAEAMRPLLEYMESHFRPDGYAVLRLQSPTGPACIARIGEWPQAEIMSKAARALTERSMAERCRRRSTMPAEASAIALETLSELAYPEEHLCPLDESAPDGAWILMGFNSRSAFLSDDPLFVLWRKQLSVLLDVRGL